MCLNSLFAVAPDGDLESDAGGDRKGGGSGGRGRTGSTDTDTGQSETTGEWDIQGAEVPVTEYVQRGALLTEVRVEGLPADGNEVVSSELQLTDDYNNAVKNEDIVALTWALARVLHLQLSSSSS
jgi:hypothetical protein